MKYKDWWSWKAVLYGEKATRDIGLKFGSALGPSAVLALSGELGSGKTSLVLFFVAGHFSCPA